MLNKIYVNQRRFFLFTFFAFDFILSSFLFLFNLLVTFAYILFHQAQTLVCV